MDIDSKIFFPDGPTSIGVSQSLRVGGCAFGGTRVKLVEYTIDDGATWSNATIVQQLDADNVWVFWDINLNFTSTGQITLQVRATDIFDNRQNRTDSNYRDGTSAWPVLTITVI